MPSYWVERKGCCRGFEAAGEKQEAGKSNTRIDSNHFGRLSAPWKSASGPASRRANAWVAGLDQRGSTSEKGPQPGGRKFSVLLEAVKATGGVFSAAYPRRVSIFGIVVGTKMDCFFKANAVQSKKLGGRASRNPPGRAESQFAGRTPFKTCPVLGGA